MKVLVKYVKNAASCHHSSSIHWNRTVFELGGVWKHQRKNTGSLLWWNFRGKCSSLRYTQLHATKSRHSKEFFADLKKL